eukprot:s3223_g5.t1
MCYATFPVSDRDSMADAFQQSLDAHADAVLAEAETTAVVPSDAVAPDTVPAAAGSATAPMQCAESSVEPPVAADAEAICAKCKGKHQVKDMIVRQTCRADLRHCCRGCKRKGIQLQQVLSEDQLVAFFAEASLQRRDAEEGRLSFMKSRALLKRHMVEEARREAAEPVERKRKGGALSSEEKEAVKRQRKEEKKLEGERKAATAAAVKVLPALKDLQKKLQEKIGKLGDSMELLPVATHEAVQKAQEKLASIVDCGTKLLEIAATGKPAQGMKLLFSKEKDLQSVAKDGNAALRSLQNFVRGQKENSNPNTGKGRGKGNGKKSE